MCVASAWLDGMPMLEVCGTPAEWKALAWLRRGELRQWINDAIKRFIKDSNCGPIPVPKGLSHGNTRAQTLRLRQMGAAVHVSLEQPAAIASSPLQLAQQLLSAVADSDWKQLECAPSVEPTLKTPVLFVYVAPGVKHDDFVANSAIDYVHMTGPKWASAVVRAPPTTFASAAADFHRETVQAGDLPPPVAHGVRVLFLVLHSDGSTGVFMWADEEGASRLLVSRTIAPHKLIEHLLGVHPRRHGVSIVMALCRVEDSNLRAAHATCVKLGCNLVISASPFLSYTSTNDATMFLLGRLAAVLTRVYGGAREDTFLPFSTFSAIVQDKCSREQHDLIVMGPGVHDFHRLTLIQPQPVPRAAAALASVASASNQHQHQLAASYSAATAKAGGANSEESEESAAEDAVVQFAAPADLEAVAMEIDSGEEKQEEKEAAPQLPVVPAAAAALKFAASAPASAAVSAIVVRGRDSAAAPSSYGPVPGGGAYLQQPAATLATALSHRGGRQLELLWLVPSATRLMLPSEMAQLTLPMFSRDQESFAFVVSGSRRLVFLCEGIQAIGTYRERSQNMGRPMKRINAILCQITDAAAAHIASLVRATRPAPIDPLTMKPIELKPKHRRVYEVRGQAAN